MRKREFLERIERSDRLHKQLSQAYRDQVQFMGEVVRRNEIAFRETSEMLAELTQEIRAQRQGFLALLDRLSDGGGAEPAGA